MPFVCNKKIDMKQGFHRRLTSGGIFNNRLLFKNNTLLFSEIFLGDKALMEGTKS